MILQQYQNGNTEVTIYSDGTKERVYEEAPWVVHPESLDVKITNHCDAGCSFCHEQSTTSGQHGNLNALKKVLSVLPAGVEIAIGGGNPFSHPALVPFLEWAKGRGLIANITVNQKHLLPYENLIAKLIDEHLIHGLGISYTSDKYLLNIKPILQATNNAVFHVIMGINTVNDVIKLKDFCSSLNKECKILILGYKEFGFGTTHHSKRKKQITDNKYEWYTTLAPLFKTAGLTLSFDNLAIKQLDLRRYFTEEGWNKFYMGDDFEYTMYVDAVEQKFAKSSTSLNRVSFGTQSLLDYFHIFK
jgi:MoaA/NifB/PqqE/SkfB family radical SAM enzyme